MAAHRTELRVRFGELDPYQHVNHAVYVAYFEVGRVEAMRAVGLDLAAMQRAGWQLVIVDLAVRYRLPAVANDLLTIETGLTEIGGASTRWRQRVLRGPDDQVLCTADIRAGVTDASGRPRRVPTELAAPLRELLVG